MFYALVHYPAVDAALINLFRRKYDSQVGLIRGSRIEDQDGRLHALPVHRQGILDPRSSILNPLFWCSRLTTTTGQGDFLITLSVTDPITATRMSSIKPAPRLPTTTRSA